MPENVKVANGFVRQSREQKSERSPSHWGRISLTPQQWNDLCAYMATAPLESDEYGQRYSLSLAGWRKEGRDGSSYVSFQVSTPREQQPQQQAPATSDPLDGVPF